MTDDLLERAAAVARRRYDGRSTASARTEALILQRLGPQLLRRRWPPLVLVPLAATLLASAAWGTTSGKFAAALHAVSRVFAMSAETAPSSARTDNPRRAASARATENSVSPKASAAPLSAPNTVAPEASVNLAPASRPRAPTVVPAPARQATLTHPALAASNRAAQSAPAPTPDALFRIANRAQFSGRDPAAAVALWDQYLSAAPNGALAPEARYNRGIALTQLGRKGEARAALQPFARGDYGTYRQSEAQQLLKALGE